MGLQEPIMMLCADGGAVRPGLPKGKDDYVRTVLLTELLADCLPRLPWYLRELQSALEAGSTDLEKVCLALKVNPAICENFARIGCMAEPAEPIRMPLDHLVVLLGKQRVWTVAVAAFLLTEIDNNWSSVAKREVASIALARANAAVVRAKADEDVALDQVYAGGVLSVIGLLPLVEASGVTDHAPEWIEVAAEAIDKQREVFGTDFLELDRWVRMIWRLPMEMSYAVAEPVSVQPYVPEHASKPLGSDQGIRNLVLVSRGSV